MPTPDKRLYFYFYLFGRRVEHDVGVEIALLPIANAVLAGQEPDKAAKAAKEAAKTALRHLEIDGSKHRWLEENREEIREAGGNESHAWSLYLDGLTDGLAREIEENVLVEAEDVLEEIDAGDEDARDSDEDEDEEESDADLADMDDSIDELQELRIVDDETVKLVSLRAKYDRWESRGRLDLNASKDDLTAVTALARDWALPVKQGTKATYALIASQVVDQVWDANKRRIRRDWRAQHLDTLVSEGMRPAKAFNRWTAGWRELAYEIAETEIKLRLAAITGKEIA